MSQEKYNLSQALYTLSMLSETLNMAKMQAEELRKQLNESLEDLTKLSKGIKSSSTLEEELAQLSSLSSVIALKVVPRKTEK
jgi:hypothetical protein